MSDLENLGLKVSLPDECNGDNVTFANELASRTGCMTTTIVGNEYLMVETIPDRRTFNEAIAALGLVLE